MRLWMLTFPFMSILSSVLSGYRYNRQFFINAVVSSPALEELILYFTQTFNRHCLSAYSVDNPKSNLQAMLSKAKDETMVISAKLLENVSVYSKKKVAENISLVTDIATGRKNLGSPYNRPAYFGLVIVSDVPVTESSSEIRLFLEEEDIDKSLIDEMGYNFQDTVGIVMADFIASVEMHWDDIEAILREYHVGNDKVATVEVVLEILKGYFWTKGLEIMVELDIKDVNLGSLFETEIEDRNMLLELVRKIVREEIMCTSVREIRNTYEACPWEIYYSEDVVLVPSDLMEQWLKKHDLWHLKKQLQVILRQNKVLYYTDGYTYRFRKNQTACETWKLRRDFFTKLGETELINLGRQVSC